MEDLGVKPDIKDFSRTQNNILNPVICENLKQVKSLEQYQTELRTLVQNQTNQVIDISDRHEMGVALNQCEANRNSKGLVLSFAGTAAYNPRTHILMAKLIQCPHYQKLPDWMKNKAYPILLQTLEEKKSAFTHWSGIDRGVMSEFLTNAKLNQKMRNFQYASFASEELEILGQPENINLESARELLTDAIKPIPWGHIHALQCAKNYLASSKKLGLDPKFIIMSHSSGGTATVKFLETLKRVIPGANADLVISLDPVKEAHLAIAEVSSQVIGKGQRETARQLGLRADDRAQELPLMVWSRDQADKLYKPQNVDRWINFYQQSDRYGLGVSPQFGIQGSPVAHADHNFFISTNLGEKAHGEMTYHPEVMSKIAEALMEQLESK